jgi:F-type H+-transporting ATPase subunit alpha
MPVERQVAVIYAVTNGFLDEFDVDKVRQWELGFHQDMAAKHQDVLDELRETGEMDEDLTERLVAAIESYNEAFAAEHSAATSA